MGVHVQSARQKARHEGIKDSVDGERSDGCRRRSEEATASVRGDCHPLWAPGRPGVGSGGGLRGQRHQEGQDSDCSAHDDIGEAQRRRRKLGEQPGHQGADADPAQVRGGRNHLGPLPARPGRAPTCSSAKYAVAVAVVSPTEMPEITRATMSPARLGTKMNNIALATLTRRATTSTRRRPAQSEIWPARNKLAMTPTAYTAYTTVTMMSEK